MLAVAALCAVAPAYAQFGSIFSDDAPRPPGDVPSAPPSNIGPPPSSFPRNQQRPPPDTRPDTPPAQPLPAPMNLPPSSRPGANSIESAPLAPLPGGPVAPQAPPQEQPQQGARTAPGQTPAQPLPGLPPGQRQPRGAPLQANTAPQPGDEVVVEPPPQRLANPTAVFSGLDKITGRIISFDVAINETVQFGALQVTPRVCYSRPPTETPTTDSYVEVDEVTLQGEIKRIFDGWMFAASPGLHAVEHPVYDVWLTDCKGAQGPTVADNPADAPPAKQPAKPPAAKPPAPRATADPTATRATAAAKRLHAGAALGRGFTTALISARSRKCRLG
ncbi:MAG: DUF2155 domain-containing protein [Pseudolabrys sp.]